MSPSVARPPDHLAYADETHHNIGRYRGIGLITLASPEAGAIIQRLTQLLNDLAIREFKWGRLRSAKHRFAAMELLNYVIPLAVRGNLRVDVLSWDIEDSRHKVPGRDDLRNLQRMYYFLFRNVLSQRWPAKCVWQLCVDESTFAPWADLNDLRVLRDWETGQVTPMNIAQICEVHSHAEPLIQIADLFAGIAVYSRSTFDKYSRWVAAPDSGLHTGLSAADWERFEVLRHLDTLCKRHKLGVSLKQNGGLRTFNPAKPVNFWWYEPQGEFDKAPG